MKEHIKQLPPGAKWTLAIIFIQITSVLIAEIAGYLLK